MRTSERKHSDGWTEERVGWWKRVHWFWCPSLRALESGADKVIYLDKDGFLLKRSDHYSCFWRDQQFRRARKSEAAAVFPQNAKPREGEVHGLYVRRRKSIPCSQGTERYGLRPEEAFWVKEVSPHVEDWCGTLMVFAWDEKGLRLNPRQAADPQFGTDTEWLGRRFRKATRSEQAEWLLFTSGQG